MKRLFGFLLTALVATAASSAWAGSSYYASLTTKVASTGGGKVYAAKSNSKPSADKYAESSGPVQSDSTDTSGGSVTLYASVDRSDPKFVTASLMTAGPGETLFSCVGHAFIRLECPHYKLDYCFSYESENVRDRLAAFFAGRLKMGLFAVPTEEFLSEYRRDGRGVWQYELNLPPDVEQRLWKIMDERAAEGLAVWALALAPHQLTDPAFVVLALGFAVGSLGSDRVYRVFRVG